MKALKPSLQLHQTPNAIEDETDVSQHLFGV